MSFKEAVMAQKNIKTLIDNTYNKNRLNHAYLLYGDGASKSEMAFYFACKLYCPNGGCMECDVCNNIINKGHMNVKYIGILENKKLVSKEQITALQEEFSKTSLVSGPRVYIVDGIDTSTVAAQNSLLKFIEEPQNNEQTYGIFVASDILNVVSTIRSRCNLIYFPVGDKKVLSLGINGDSIKIMMLREFCSSKEEIINYLDDEVMNKTLELVFKFMDINEGYKGVLFYLNNFSILSGKYLKCFLNMLIIIYEDMLHIEYDNDLLFSLIRDKIEVYRNRLGVNKIKENLDILLKLLKRCSYNVIDKNILHELVMRIYC